MRNIRSARALCVTWVLYGCGGDAHGTRRPDVDSGVQVSGPIRITGEVLEETNWVDPGSPIPSVGTEVCIYGDDSISCSTTGTNGRFEILGVPTHTDITLSYIKTGFIKQVRPVRTGDADMDLPRQNGLGFMFNDHGQNDARNQANRGDLDFFTGTGHGLASGVKVTLVSGPAVAANYDGFPGLPAPPGATATVSGSGYFRLDPGEVTIAFEAPAGPCLGMTGLYGWPSRSGNLDEIRGPVIAGFDTNSVGALCPDAPVAVPPTNAGGVTDAGRD